MNKPSKTHLITLLIFTFSAVPFVRAQKTAEPMPNWVQEHFAFMTQGSGRWITDNSTYKSKDEPFDAYGTEWKWGVGKKSIRGRLFALKDKQEVATFWEYQLFWHPQERRVVFEQFGGSGVYGSGELRNITSADQTERITEMIFYSPDGTSWRDLHRLFESKDSHQTISYDFKDGSWEQGRTYIWKLEKPMQN